MTQQVRHLCSSPSAADGFQALVKLCGICGISVCYGTLYLWHSLK
jgi:hypothetical protein